jgi:hypothetical protein
MCDNSLKIGELFSLLAPFLFSVVVVVVVVEKTRLYRIVNYFSHIHTSKAKNYCLYA